MSPRQLSQNTACGGGRLATDAHHSASGRNLPNLHAQSASCARRGGYRTRTPDAALETRTGAAQLVGMLESELCQEPAASGSIDAIRDTTPGLSSMGEGRRAPELFVCASRRPQRAGDNCRRDCFGRVHMHLEADLGRDAGARDRLAEASDGATVHPSRKCALAPAAPPFTPEQSESYTVSRSAAN